MVICVYTEYILFLNIFLCTIRGRSSLKPEQKCGLEVGGTRLGRGSWYNREQRERGRGIVKQQNKRGIKNKTTMEVYRVMCSLVYKNGP